MSDIVLRQVHRRDATSRLDCREGQPSSPFSGRPAAARRRSCASIAGLVDISTRARSRSAAGASTTCRSTSAISAWSSRTTRCFRTRRVFDNVAFGLKYRNVAKRRDRPRKVKRALDMVRLPGVEKKLPSRTVGRPAAAHRARPRHRHRARRAAARRAAVGARRQSARGDARRDQEDPAASRHHHDLRDARPGRGAVHVRPDRGHESRQGRTDRHARRPSTASPPRASSRASSASQTFSKAASRGSPTAWR